MKEIKQKFDDAYKSIGEVAKDLNLINPKTGKLNTHTIRFWEKEFKQIKPKIFAGKRRYYNQKTIKYGLSIFNLLYSNSLSKNLKSVFLYSNTLPPAYLTIACAAQVSHSLVSPNLG